MQTSIFRSYDIRGIYPSELNEEVAYLIGKAVVKKAGAKKVAVGRDMRLSGEALQGALMRGMAESGAEVHDLGLIPVDFIYWAVPSQGYDAGVEVTASHNPKEYNGFKMMDRERVIRGKEIEEEVKRMKEGKVVREGKVVPVDYWDVYISNILKFVDAKKLKKLKVVVDAGNGMAGAVFLRLRPHLPIEIIPLFFELDGNFPNRAPNPLMPGALDQLKQKVVAEKADFGVAFDADSDRIFFVDEAGGFVQADVILLLLAKYWLTREPGAGIAYNLICSKAVPEFIQEWGGRPLKSPVGFVNVLQALKEGNGVMGGEVSAHYCFRDNYYGDSGYIAFVNILELFSHAGKPLSHLIEEYARYCRGDEINFKVVSSHDVMQKLVERYSDATIDRLDGITFEYSDWWFNVRPSNTEPLLRVTVEGNDCWIMEQKRKEISEFITKIVLD